jgi:hypothetical protein
VFSWIAEYPILIVLAALCRPMDKERWPFWSRPFWPLLVVLAVALIVPSQGKDSLFDWFEENRVYVAGGVAVFGMLLALGLNASRLKLAALAALALVLVRVYPSDDGRVDTVRSFYGTKVEGRPEPISYYHKDGGIGQAVTAIRERKGAPLRVAAIGLGSGTLTCVGLPGESWKFFEIDQSMVDTARDPKYFTYVQNCQPDLKPVIGDARLTFAREPDGVYDLIIVDAYSSDAIPIHLATQEAMKIYKDKLSPQGVVLMHVSNRHLELASVVVGIADANGMKSWVYNEDSGRDGEYIFATNVVVSARDEADIGTLASSDKWEETEAKPDQRVWTDDYCNVLGAVYRRLRDGE